MKARAFDSLLPPLCTTWCGPVLGVGFDPCTVHLVNTVSQKSLTLQCHTVTSHMLWRNQVYFSTERCLSHQRESLIPSQRERKSCVR